jgi:FkbM family methyltransferase
MNAPRPPHEAAAPGEFFDLLMERVFLDLHETHPDNVDTMRFPGGTAKASPDNFVLGLKFVLANLERLFQGCRVFHDRVSRDIYCQLLRLRLAGELHVKLSANTPQFWESRRRILDMDCGSSQFDLSGHFGDLKLCTIPWEDGRLTLHTQPYNLWSLYSGQYYFSRQGTGIRPEPDDVVLEGGACLGEFSCCFARSVGPGGSVHAFEVVKEHLDVFEENRRLNGLDNLHIVAAGLSDQRKAGKLVHLGSIVPGFQAGSADPPMTTVDAYVASKGLARVDYLKLDIEGSESACLEGAMNALRRHRPKLAVSLYHQLADLFRIPLRLATALPDYRFFLDHHTIHHEETVLYGAPVERLSGA